MEIKICGTGQNSDVRAQVDDSFDAMRTNLRPLEFSLGGLIGGHFLLAATFSNTAGQPVVSSQLFSWRWSDTRMLCVIKRIAIQVGITTAFGAAQLLDYDLIAARSFTSNPTGGTSITPATTSNKMRSATMSGSLFTSSGSIMISSGTALTAGTQTLDGYSLGYAIGLDQMGAGTTATVVPATMLAPGPA